MGNKFIFQRGFTLPLTLTLVHMLTQSLLAALTIEGFRAVDKVPVSRPDYFRKVLPISAVFCANIVLGNVSLRFLPVSFMQVRFVGGTVAPGIGPVASLESPPAARYRTVLLFNAVTNGTTLAALHTPPSVWVPLSHSVHGTRRRSNPSRPWRRRSCSTLCFGRG